MFRGTAGVCCLEFEKVLGRQARDTAGIQPAFCGLRFTAKETDQNVMTASQTQVWCEWSRPSWHVRPGFYLCDLINKPTDVPQWECAGLASGCCTYPGGSERAIATGTESHRKLA